MAYIRTLLVDDSLEFLEAAKLFLSSDPQIEVVGCSQSGPEALEQIPILKPDLVLMDLDMPGPNGLETTRTIKAQVAPPQVIILTLHDDLEYRLASRTARADGFISKSEFGAELLPQIYSLFPEKLAAATLD